VTFSVKALNEASSAGVNVEHLVTGALDHINALLPGPPNTVSVLYDGDAADLISQTGTYGVTNSAGGAVVVAFGPTAQAGVGKALGWLPHTLAHEIDHSVRALAGPGTGFGVNLLDEIVSEGIASVFDEAAFSVRAASALTVVIVTTLASAACAIGAKLTGSARTRRGA